jgi:hypothetical protein
MRDTGNSYRVSVGKPQGKRSIGRPRFRWGANIKADVKGIAMGSSEVLENS